jgi:integrase
MRLPHHLLRHPSGVYHFRLMVPEDLRSVLGLRVIKRSVHTRDIAKAQIAAWHLSAAYARAFEVLRGGTMGKFDPPSVDEILSNVGGGRRIDYTIDRKNGFFQSNDEEDHRRAMEMMAASTEAARAEAAVHEARARAVDAEAGIRSAQHLAALEAAIPRPPAPLSASGFTLSQMIAEWERVGTETINKETAKTRKRIMEEFANHYGAERPISGVRRTDVSAWSTSLVEGGKNGQGNSKTTRNNKCSHLKELFTCAINRGHYDASLGNPATDVEKFARGEKSKISKRVGWKPFTTAQLQQLFAPASIEQTEMPHTRRGMVIGLYTGARVSEVAQLELSYFTVVDGVPCMRFDGELKTDVSERVIPIHPDLIRLGLLDWVAEQKRRKQTRLFPTVNTTGKNKGGAISKGTTNLLVRLGITAENRDGRAKRVGFHSFRSTVIQELQSADEDERNAERRRAYVGHAPYEKRDTSAHKKHYMRAWKPNEIEVLHQGITWGEWLDFDALKRLLAQGEPDQEAIIAKRKVKRAATRAAKGAR